MCDVQDVGVSQPTVSHHLKKLREAGLLTSERRGTWVYYRVASEVLAAMAGLLPAARRSPWGAPGLPGHPFIGYRRLSMNGTSSTGPGIDAESAERCAAWFRALADPTRIRLLNLLAVQGRPMSVGEIVERASVGQSTVSHHLKILAEVRFVLPERQGTSTRYEVNRACLTVFPAAVRAILGESGSERTGGC